MKPTAPPPAYLTMRDLVATLGYTHQEFADAVGFSQPHVSRILAGHMTISPQLAYVMQEKFDLDALTLLTEQSRWQLYRISVDGLEEHQTDARKGRKVTIDEKTVRRLAAEGTSVRQIAAAVRRSYTTVWRFMRDNDIQVARIGLRDPVPKPRKDTRPVHAHRRYPDPHPANHTPPGI